MHGLFYRRGSREFLLNFTALHHFIAVITPTAWRLRPWAHHLFSQDFVFPQFIGEG